MNRLSSRRVTASHSEAEKRSRMEDCNKKLEQFETIKKILIVPDEFTVAGGEITPTLKLKRRVIESKYKQQIEELYQEPHPIETAPVG